MLTIGNFRYLRINTTYLATNTILASFTNGIGGVFASELVPGVIDMSDL